MTVQPSLLDGSINPQEFEATKLAEKILEKYPATVGSERLFLIECLKEIDPKFAYLSEDMKASLSMFLGKVGSLRKRRKEVTDKLALSKTH